MASTFQMAGSLTPAATADEASAAGVRRSRLSLHLNTSHMRRWLLVQFVSVPLENTNEVASVGQKSLTETEAPGHNNLGFLLDEYLDTRMLRRGF